MTKAPEAGTSTADSPPVELPQAMLAELTHRCPLACPYCSNPLGLVGRRHELSAADWAGVFEQAADLGVLQLHISGGEPAARRDLETITASASAAGLYTNLVTSGIGLTRARLEALETAGLDHVQLSLQGITAEVAEEIGGYAGSFARKMEVARWIVDIGFPLTLNAVMHRRNLDQLEDVIAFAVEIGARRLEVACVQFHGWALLNRAALMPSPEQAAAARATVAQARARLKGTLVIDFVPPDYYATRPKACMGGWGRVGLNVCPDGTVLPCHAAATIPGLAFWNVRMYSLEEIWWRNPAFEAFRGDGWMREPCRSCEYRHADWGGCRCQALALAGDAAATDPTCAKSPQNARLRAQAEEWSRGEAPFVYRKAPI